MAKQKILNSFFTLEEKKLVERIKTEMVKERGPYDLPEDWKWITLGEVVLRTQYGMSKAMNTEKVGIPIIRMGNITYDGKLDLSDLKYIDLDKRTADEYVLNKGDILFNRTNSRELVGKTTVFDLDGEYTFVSYIIRVVVDRSKVLPEYIQYFLNSKRGKEILFNMARPAVQMANINAKELCRIKIPLAPLEEQKRIVARVSELASRAEKAKRLRRIAREEAEKIMQAALHKVFSRAEEEWGLTRLVKICKINPSKSEIKALPDDIQITFVPMVAVSEITGKIEKPEVRPLGEVRKGYTYFREGDVLFAKITPCMENGKSTIARNLVNGLGFGSTEFHVLRALREVISEWLYYYIRQKSFRDEAAKNMTGSVGQQRVPVQFLKNIKIPLPPVEQQKRMVAYLDKIRKTAESLGKLQQGTEEDLEKLVSAILDKAFKGEL